MNIPKPTTTVFPQQHSSMWWNKSKCGIKVLFGYFGISKIRTKLTMNCKVSDECKKYGDCSMDSSRKKDNFVDMMREAWPYFHAYRGRIFVVVLCAEVIQSTNLGTILEDISLLHGLGIRFVLVPGTHVQIDDVLAEKRCEPKYVGRYRVTDHDSLNAAIDSAGRICLMIQAKLSPGPTLNGIRRHGDNNHWHHSVSVASGNFVAAKKRGVVEGVDYGATGEVKKIDFHRIRDRLDSDSIVILSNLGYSSSGDVLNCNTCEVATACALALEAEKLIFITDGPILDESGRLIRFLTLEDADKLIPKSEIAGNYVKPVGEEAMCCATFQNGVGFNHGNSFWSNEVGFVIGGQERLCRPNGYLSELAAAAAFVCRGGDDRVHLLDGNIDGVLLKELFQRDGVGKDECGEVAAIAVSPDCCEHRHGDKLLANLQNTWRRKRLPLDCRDFSC